MEINKRRDKLNNLMCHDGDYDRGLPMKVIERENEGYSHDRLADFFGNVRFISPSNQALAPVRGICFAAGSESPHLAKEFITKYLGMGCLGVRMHTVSAEKMRWIKELLHGDHIAVSNVAILLHDLDLIVPGMEGIVVETVNETAPIAWFATAVDPQMIHPRLRLPLLVYLGLGKRGRMRYLVQDEQRLMIDKGSFNKSKE